METWQKGYVAGVIDSEGSFLIAQMKRAKYGFSGRLRTTNTSKSLLDYLKQLTGLGGVTTSRKHQKEPQRKTLHEWYVGRNGLPKLLSEVKDYLFLKKEHSDILLKFFATDDIEEIGKLKSQLDVLNKRGKQTSKEVGDG